MIPGRTLHRLASHICSAKTLERVVEPAIADLQKEYVSAGHLSRRVSVLVGGYAGILKAIAICALSVSVAGEDERLAIVRTFAWSASMVVVVVVLLMLPPLFTHSGMGWRMATTLVPQAVPLGVPIGIAFGVAFGLAARPALNIAKVIVCGAVAASLLSFAVLAWGVPAANQAFREMTFRELRAQGYQGDISGQQKGYSEMTFSELRRQEADFLANGEPRRASSVRLSFHRRFALAAATVALVSFLLGVPVNHRGLRGMLAFIVCFVYWMLMFAGEVSNRRGYLPVPIAAWLPNLVMIASAIFIASSSSSRLRGERGVAQ